jgi:hypothetical protein
MPPVAPVSKLPETAVPVVAAPLPTAERIAPKQADAEAVKKRFEQRQAGLEGLFKDKGKLT